MPKPVKTLPTVKESLDTYFDLVALVAHKEYFAGSLEKMIEVLAHARDNMEHTAVQWHRKNMLVVALRKCHRELRDQQAEMMKRIGSYETETNTDPRPATCLEAMS